MAIGGLGAIGLEVARAIDREPGGLELIAVAASNLARAAQAIVGFRHSVAAVEAEMLAEADIVVEAAPAAVFERIVVPAIERGRTVVTTSVGAWLTRQHLIDKARETGAVIVIPSGGIAGLDALRAAALGDIRDVIIRTRKKPKSLVDAPFVKQSNLDLNEVAEPVQVFSGNALGAATGFPANANVGAALALAGTGPQRTRVEIYADPGVTRNVHEIQIESDAVRCRFSIESVPSPENPRTSRLAALSVIACLRNLTATLRFG